MESYFRQIKIKHQILELTSAHLTRHCKFVPWIIKTLEIYGKCFPQSKMFPCANAYATQGRESLQAAAAENRPIFHLAKAPPPLAPPTPPPWLQLNYKSSCNLLITFTCCNVWIPSAKQRIGIRSLAFPTMIDHITPKTGNDILLRRVSGCFSRIRLASSGPTVGCPL